MVPSVTEYETEWELCGCDRAEGGRTREDTTKCRVKHRKEYFLSGYYLNSDFKSVITDMKEDPAILTSQTKTDHNTMSVSPLSSRFNFDYGKQAAVINLSSKSGKKHQ